jgi:hypothetical protein
MDNCLKTRSKEIDELYKKTIEECESSIFGRPSCSGYAKEVILDYCQLVAPPLLNSDESQTAKKVP